MHDERIWKDQRDGQFWLVRIFSGTRSDSVEQERLHQWMLTFRRPTSVSDPLSAIHSILFDYSRRLGDMEDSKLIALFDAARTESTPAGAGTTAVNLIGGSLAAGSDLRP